jgi:hypothetical protein
MEALVQPKLLFKPLGNGFEDVKEPVERKREKINTQKFVTRNPEGKK